MASTTATTQERHPKGLYVLCGTEMWERFGFYTMLAMLTLYMRDAAQGFGWTTAKATGVYSWYQALVYATPLIGGWLADRFLGYRNAITIGGLFFMAGYFLLAVPHNVPLFYLSLLLLVVGNGFFKPNVSSMVGNLYREGSHLKDRAYLIFYMGINIGAFLAPLIAEYVKARAGFNPAFAVAGVGMVICLGIFWGFRGLTRFADRPRVKGDFAADAADQNAHAEAVAVTEDLPPTKHEIMEAVPEWKRIMALIVIFLIVIVFWMIFHQNGSTLTFWANDNTDWNVTGIISNAINPFWIITLSLPLAWFWGWLDRRGKEPSTPMKMAFGMTLTGLSLLILYFAALNGGYTKPAVQIVAAGPTPQQVYVNATPDLAEELGVAAQPAEIQDQRPSTLSELEEGASAPTVRAYLANVGTLANAAPGGLAAVEPSQGAMVLAAVRKVSPVWLILSYFVISLGELMLSPMGLALVSKVAPPRMRGLMMGGWFLATAIGNKLTAIGAYWDVWSHARFFLTLSLMAFGMAVVLFLLIRPLKKAMPGV
ncbi:MAG TPA: peptide MFS transporter [Thermoanaerobaculia bacterium]